MSSTEESKSSDVERKKTAAKPHWKTKTNHLADLMSNVLEEVVARKSGMTLDMIAAWDEIAGPNYADCTKAEKIVWPRRSSDLDPFEPGMLIVACDDAKAVFFQHESGQVIERLNQFFGFEAVAKIKIVQKPIKQVRKERHKIPDKLSDEKETKLEGVLGHITDPVLREKIAKFGRGVMSKRK